MNQSEQDQALTIAAVPQVQKLLDQWAASLGQVLESMIEVKPEIEWKAAPAPGGQPEDLWWEQPFSAGPDVVVWVAAPRPTWEKAGAMTLKAAGLENVETAEAKSTWIEILSQSLSAMARSIGSMLGREVTCDAGAETPPAAPQESAVVSIVLGDAPVEPLTMAISPKLLGLLAGRALTPNSSAPGPAPGQQTESAAGAAGAVAPPPTMELLMDVELPVSVSFGKTQLPMKDVLKLTTGSIVELNRGVNETVEVLVNHSLIARGEVVVVEGNYGVRIQQITSKQERLRTIR